MNPVHPRDNPDYEFSVNLGEYVQKESWAESHPEQVIADMESLHNIVPTVSAFSRQEGGSHYSACAIQPLEFITANGLDFLTGNVVKYAVRAGKKQGQSELDDWRKALHYCQMKVEMLEREGA
jgi:hypothetical protein